MASSRITLGWIAKGVAEVFSEAAPERLLYEADSAPSDAKLISVWIAPSLGWDPQHAYETKEDEDLCGTWRTRYLVPAGQALAEEMRRRGFNALTDPPYESGNVHMACVRSASRGVSLLATQREGGEIQLAILAFRDGGEA